MQVLHYYLVFLQVAMLCLNQWSVSCSTAFLFFLKLSMCSSLRERASGHDWFSCESQQNPHCSSSSLQFGDAPLPISVRPWQRRGLWVCLKLLQLFAAISNKAQAVAVVVFTATTQWFTGQTIPVRSSHRSKWAIFWSLWAPILTSISYREVPTRFLNSTRTSWLHSQHLGFWHLCLMPDVYLKSASHL